LHHIQQGEKKTEFLMTTAEPLYLSWSGGGKDPIEVWFQGTYHTFASVQNAQEDVQRVLDHLLSLPVAPTRWVVERGWFLNETQRLIREWECAERSLPELQMVDPRWFVENVCKKLGSYDYPRASPAATSTATASATQDPTVRKILAFVRATTKEWPADRQQLLVAKIAPFLAPPYRHRLQRTTINHSTLKTWTLRCENEACARPICLLTELIPIQASRSPPSYHCPACTHPL
jgi:hypothetical protein